ncbi:MAG TPA: nuclear transport factor 2 family protein [Jatrophihabitantaceae bacterium]|jgi:hypothetical protein
MVPLVLYAQCVDYQVQDRWRDCFTDDAVVELRLPGADRQPMMLQGIQGIADAVPGAAAVGGQLHAISNVIVDMHSNQTSATVHSCFARIGVGRGLDVLISYGYYEDTVVLGEDGRWRLARRAITVVGRKTTTRLQDDHSIGGDDR